MSTPQRRPGDLLLNRYCENADPETREAAREAFREFARILEALGEAELMHQHDSHESPEHDTIPAIPPAI
jgi:thymidylate synthase ThyX